MKNSEFRELFEEKLREHPETKDKFMLSIETKTGDIKS